MNPELSRWRWPLYALGTAMMAWGAWGQVHGADTKPARVAVLWVASALGHDLVIAPVVVVVGLLVRRLPRRGVVQGALLVAGGLVLVAVPALGRFGARADNPSVLPRDYRAGLLVALGVVAVVAGTVALLSRRRGARPVQPE